VNTFRSSDEVFSVSISPKATMIASGSRRNLLVGRSDGRMSHHRYQRRTRRLMIRTVDYVNFFPRFLNASCPCHNSSILQQWTTDGEKIGPEGYCSSIAVSPDRSRFALGGKGTLTIQDSASGEITATLHPPCQDLNTAIFPPVANFWPVFAKALSAFGTSRAPTQALPSLGPLLSMTTGCSLVYSSSALISTWDTKGQVLEDRWQPLGPNYDGYGAHEAEVPARFRLPYSASRGGYRHRRC
jgi:WD40 repeat protein